MILLVSMAPDRHSRPARPRASGDRSGRPVFLGRRHSPHVTTPHTAHADRDAAFQREALRWIDDVYRFALSLTRDEADAEDIVQDTYLRAYRSWHTYLPDSDCRRWLFTICRNVFLRSRERERPTVDLESADVDVHRAGSVYLSALNEGLEALFARLDLAPAITEALRNVPEPFRSALVIVDVEDQSYEAAAAVLGVPIGTIRSRLFRGRRLMQEQLLAYARDAGFPPPPGEEAGGHD